MSDAEKLLRAMASYASKYPDFRLGQLLHIIGLDVNSVNYKGFNYDDIFHLSDEISCQMWNEFLDSFDEYESPSKSSSKLCYVEKSYDDKSYEADGTYILYFTTKDLKDQWGDDWNDTPFEHNAGRPYSPFRPDLKIEERLKNFPDDWNEDGSPKWEIFTLRLYIENGRLPNDGYYNSPYSVDDINTIKSMPWIRTEQDNLNAGIEYDRVIDIAIKNKWVRYYE